MRHPQFFPELFGHMGKMLYLNIDDGYFGGRDTVTGRLLIHPVRFPNGLQCVVDHIHGLGLKAGIYSDARAKELRVES